MLLQQFRSIGRIQTSSSTQSQRQEPSPAIWIDLENVRGKSGFELTHRQVLDKTRSWIEYHQLHNHVIVVADHGATSCAYYLQNDQMTVVFAGDDSRPSIKADDVIADGVSLFGKTLVVTADNELRSRCRRSAQCAMHIMEPQRFLDDLEYVATLQQQQHDKRPQQQDQTEDITTGESPTLSQSLLDDEIKLGKLESEIKLKGQLLEAEIQLDKKGKSMTNKRRKKIQARILSLRKKLAMRGPSLLDRITSQDGVDEAEMSREQQDLILARWRELQHQPMRKERTGDRVIYAERLRRELDKDEQAVLLLPDNHDCSISNMSESVIPSALAFAVHVNTVGPTKRQTKHQQQRSVPCLPSRNGIDDDDSKCLDLESVCPPELSTQQRLEYENNERLETIKIVCISDTHGFEQQLDQPLPQGDVLLHLGDFALEGSHEKEHRGLREFDTWLAKQPHPYKIILRGNHDPWLCEFPVSKSLYVTQPTSINLGGFEIALVPHSSARKMAASAGLPPTCDVMASHLPPFKILDRTYTGKYAGSNYLLAFVRGMVQPPRVWLVGHIHEGRGIQEHHLGKHRDCKTTVINCSNANHGRATHLTHGPVTFTLHADDSKVQITQMEDNKINRLVSRQQFFHRESDQNHRSLLLAVDLGLKSGISLYSQDGILLRYEQFNFVLETLHQEITAILNTWETETNTDESATESDAWKITHVAIEGGDTSLLSTWSEALPDISLLRVSPEEWRSELLTKNERQSGPSAKAASRLIARQFVEDFGQMELHSGKFPTDVAESILLGMYCCRKLGWSARDPAVRRYSNGNVITPKKVQMRKEEIHA
jgi:hypothetical protein